MYLDNSLAMDDDYSTTHTSRFEAKVTKWEMLTTNVLSLFGSIFRFACNQKVLVYFLATPNHLSFITPKTVLRSRINDYSPDNMKALTWKYHDPKQPRANYISGKAHLLDTLVNGLANRDQLISKQEAVIHIIFIDGPALTAEQNLTEWQNIFTRIKNREEDKRNEVFLFVCIEKEGQAVVFIRQQIEDYSLTKVIQAIALTELDTILSNTKNPLKKILKKFSSVRY